VEVQDVHDASELGPVQLERVDELVEMKRKILSWSREELGDWNLRPISSILAFRGLPEAGQAHRSNRTSYSIANFGKISQALSTWIEAPSAVCVTFCVRLFQFHDIVGRSNCMVNIHMHIPRE
jgi:hypothetical protein